MKVSTLRCSWFYFFGSFEEVKFHTFSELFKQQYETTTYLYPLKKLMQNNQLFLELLNNT